MVLNNTLIVAWLYTNRTNGELDLNFPIVFTTQVNCVSNVIGFGRWCEVNKYSLSNMHLTSYTPNGWNSSLTGYNVIIIGF